MQFFFVKKPKFWLNYAGLSKRRFWPLLDFQAVTQKRYLRSICFGWMNTLSTCKAISYVFKVHTQDYMKVNILHITCPWAF